jgi:RHS repeat-associated protein
MLPTASRRSMPTRAGLSHARGRKSALPGFLTKNSSNNAPGKSDISQNNDRGKVSFAYGICNGSTCYGTYVDEPLLYVNGSTKYYVHSNHLYSVAALTDGSGAVVERYRYNAYGKRTVMNAAGTLIPKSTIGFQRGFTGYYLDAETGLYFARARMYSAGLGKFIERDFSPGPERKKKGSRDNREPMLLYSGYKDGMSLYSAYFIPNSLDSSGHYKDYQDCLNCEYERLKKEKPDASYADLARFSAEAQRICHELFPEAPKPPEPPARPQETNLEWLTRTGAQPKKDNSSNENCPVPIKYCQYVVSAKLGGETEGIQFAPGKTRLCLPCDSDGKCPSVAHVTSADTTVGKLDLAIVHLEGTGCGDCPGTGATGKVVGGTVIVDK